MGRHDLSSSQMIRAPLSFGTILFFFSLLSCPLPLHSSRSLRHHLLLRSQNLTPTPLLQRGSSCDAPLCRTRRYISVRASAAQLAAAGVATAQLPELGVEEEAVGFVTGKRKATEVAHAQVRILLKLPSSYPVQF
ncbi:uncharacterized protein LOC8080099 isoform X2 [Sorghum bicolor]|uniref:uncharacterized protein LOC8080099 isoform X2 n=1 Tax=Sorghum bicolor TaxID=4558 RepID=UPI000B425FA7|nr:uncharacterized protein LOC8080099 isoform X2 [Sorghum bicolor]|eukprot:XP_021303898.1 uncharacterized protein LOC8080099 isoform X2 [Sorghum bicolor]